MHLWKQRKQRADILNTKHLLIHFWGALCLYSKGACRYERRKEEETEMKKGREEATETTWWFCSPLYVVPLNYPQSIMPWKLRISTPCMCNPQSPHIKRMSRCSSHRICVIEPRCEEQALTATCRWWQNEKCPCGWSPNNSTPGTHVLSLLMSGAGSTVLHRYEGDWHGF